MKTARELAAVTLEALEAGDQGVAVVMLLNALEDGERVDRMTCLGCGARFEWPGLLQSHRDRGCPSQRRGPLEERRAA